MPYSMNEIPLRLNLWTFTLFFDKLFREMKNPKIGGCIEIPYHFDSNLRIKLTAFNLWLSCLFFKKFK